MLCFVFFQSFLIPCWKALTDRCQAEESKVCGNDAFSKERYEKAPEVEEGKTH